VFRPRTLVSIATLAGLALLAGCAADAEAPEAEAGDLSLSRDVAAAIETPAPTGTPRPTLAPPASELVTTAEFPAVMAFAPDGRLFFNELKTGNVRVISAEGALLAEPFATVPVADGVEWGLIGLAIDPEFETNRYVYIFFTAPVVGLAQPTIMRFRDENNVGVEPTVIVQFPVTPPDHESIHVSGNLHFGPGGYLWVTLGDYALPTNSQDVTVPMGSVLRIDRNGLPAPDNPFVAALGADRRIYAYGFRNSFDFAFHPETGALYATENGLDNCDEINLVVAGENYGWPASYRHSPPDCDNGLGRPAVYYFPVGLYRPPTTGTVAPTGIEFVSGDAYPGIGDAMLVCEFNTGRMIAYAVSGSAPSVVIPLGTVADDCYIEITIAPDGTVYYSNPGEIRRLLPGAE
jgi:glucose/arabinose dehydrogenase